MKTSQGEENGVLLLGTKLQQWYNSTAQDKFQSFVSPIWHSSINNAFTEGMSISFYLIMAHLWNARSQPIFRRNPPPSTTRANNIPPAQTQTATSYLLPRPPPTTATFLLPTLNSSPSTPLPPTQTPSHLPTTLPCTTLLLLLLPSLRKFF